MTVREGLAILKRATTQDRMGPSRARPGFFNKSQKLNRDITILFLRYAKPRRALDGFGGTGIRGIRYYLEANVETVISERNKLSAEIIKDNIADLRGGVTFSNESFEATLSHSLFDFIDVDPYGSPLQYFDQSIYSVKNNGYVAITATDLSALTGSVPSKTFLRYDARVINDIYRHETGIRVLIGSFVRRAASLGREAIPQLSIWYSHYYRVIFRIRNGTSLARKALDNIGYINKHKVIFNRYPSVEEGPLWLGNLFSRDFLSSIEIPDYLSDNVLLRKYVDRIKHEDTQLYFTDISELAKFRHISPPPVSHVIDILKTRGVSEVGRTTFSPTGIKSILNTAEIFDMLLNE